MEIECSKSSVETKKSGPGAKNSVEFGNTKSGWTQWARTASLMWNKIDS